MKNLLLIVFLLTTILSYAQTEYYTSDGKERLIKSELNNIMLKMEDQFTKSAGKKVHVSFKIQKTQTKKDSIIHTITFGMSTKKSPKTKKIDLLSELKNKKLPAFNLKTLSDKSFNSEQLEGKPTMINFWYTRCKPCIKEMPILNRIAEKYKNQINFITITFEEKKDVEAFLKKHPFNFTHLVNAKSFIESLGIKSYPTNLFLDKNRVLKFINNGIPQTLQENGTMKMEQEGTVIIQLIEKLKS